MYINSYNKYIYFLSKYSPKTASKILFNKNQSKKLDLKNPKTFNEKLMYLKLNDYYDNELVTICVDKYRVREYIQKKGCNEILNELIGVYDNTDEIDFKKLPQKFVLKCNHGCGYNIICDNKKRLNIEETKEKLNTWMKEEYWRKYAETNYKNVEKKIICEKYLDTDAGFLPNDYKIYCFNGEPKLILVCTDRAKKTKLCFFDLDWNKLDIGSFESDAKIEKPKSLDKMIEYSKKLCVDFPFVRIDFYEYKEKPIFGEMTFSPAGCIAKYYTEEGLEELGNMLKI